MTGDQFWLTYQFNTGSIPLKYLNLNTVPKAMLNAVSVRVRLIAIVALVAAVGLTTIALALESPDDSVSSEPTKTPAVAPARPETPKNVRKDVIQRFTNLANADQPDFQRHVAPLLGRLGCNGRACHGSFQGQGGFQLSLFGYDFDADHKALLTDGRVDVEDPDESLVLTKPTDEDNHEGGLRYEKGSWQFNLISTWIKNGATTPKTIHKLDRLVVEPSELQIQDPNQKLSLIHI